MLDDNDTGAKKRRELAGASEMCRMVGCGLDTLKGRQPYESSSGFVVKPFATKGFAPGVNEQKFNQLLETLEIERRRK